MEYHFTGTGSSPDFTFIADGIIDGTGKVIPYSAVKSTKVKRKGHESILTLETKENGTKTEYCYSVDSKDDKDLRRAVIDIESIYLKERKGKRSPKWKIIGVTVAVLLICGGGAGWYANSKKLTQNVNTQTQEAVEDNEPRIEFKETETTKRTDTRYNCPEYTVYPADTNIDKIVWTSTDESIAKVENGMLYAGKEGTAQITATLDDNVSASMTVNVESKANKVLTSPYNHSNSGSSSTYIPRSSWTTGGPGANQSAPNSQESKNALSKAERYYHNQDLSKSQVREQLEFEGYEKDAIDYAMKNLTYAFTARMAGQTMDGEILEGRYYSNYVLCKNDIYVNLTYHYYDEGLIMHGWDSTQWTMEELEAYRTDSDLWEKYLK